LFLSEIAPLYGIALVPHPRKANDIYETDFQAVDGSFDIDLKHVTTPFFTAGKYGVDPRFAITLNHKDYLRYMYKYPEWGDRKMYILFWVEFLAVHSYGTTVDDLNGLWYLNIDQLDQWVRGNNIRCHSYQQRQGECGSNAKHSWVIDLRWCGEYKKARP